LYVIKAYHPKPTSTKALSRGFTVVELLIVIAVTAILLALATPNLRGVIERNQLVGQANELAAAMALARSEAVSRGIQAGVCASSDDGASCSGSWTGNDIVVFIDEDNSGDLDGGERVLKVFPTNGDLTLTGTADEFLFRPNGFGVITNADLGVTVCHAGNPNCRIVTVRPSGIVSVTKS